MGHACSVAGRAGVAAGVDGEGLPNFQGPCGWEWGTERDEGTRNGHPRGEAGWVLIHPTLVSLLQTMQPASLPICKEHAGTWACLSPCPEHNHGQVPSALCTFQSLGQVYNVESHRMVFRPFWL